MSATMGYLCRFPFRTYVGYIYLIESISSSIPGVLVGGKGT